MTRRDFVIGAALLAAAVPAFGQAPRRPRASDWANMATMLPDGAVLIGNPRAPHRLTEFLSYTCGHCAHFYADATPRLMQGLVAGGRLAVELRPAVRDGPDLAAALLARCGGPGRMSGNSAAIFAAQPRWMAAGVAFQQQEADRLRNLPPARALAEVAGGAGLVALMRSRGFTQAQLDACLADPAAQASIARLADDAWTTRRIPGTPYFLLDGRPLVGAHDWASLQPQLPR